MTTVVFLSLLLSAAPNDGSPASSQSLESPPVVDDSPTAWSCTADTLRSGKDCVFEAELTPSEPNKDQAANNVRTIQQLGRTLCAEAARASSEDGKPDRNLAASCEKRYSTAAERCDLQGTVPIVDTKGRFAPAARACYRAVSGVLQETQMMATVAAPCCQCAAQSGCPGAGDRCYADLTQQKAGASTLACMRDRCADSCSLAPPAAAPKKAAAPPKSEPRPEPGSASL
ncbi:hypothetical protein [Hyalangium versicolor]|uniref:hypothetical protein n=1 Tax=Hyalangium versicolor TaxID=2861190 RepID=UPI001CCFE1B4|nr:hypothetical protein [Hyalangium versicolor]